MEYNTTRTDIVLKEYGRNVEKLVNYLKTIEDKDKRTAYAHTLIDLMRQLSPSEKETTETNQKLWDDLYIMADFDIEIDGPFPKPEEEVLNRKPDRLGYKSNQIKYRHYGKNIELLIQEAKGKTDPQEREDAIIYIGKLMKSFYGSWNKEGIDDGVILENIKTISNGELSIDLDKVKEDNLFERLYKSRKKPTRPPVHKGRRNKGGGRGRRRN